MTEAQILRKLAKRDRLAALLKACDQELNLANREFWGKRGCLVYPRLDALRRELAS